MDCNTHRFIFSTNGRDALVAELQFSAEMDEIGKFGKRRK